MEPAAASTFLGKILKKDTAAKLTAGSKKIEDYDIPGVDMKQFVNQIKASLYLVVGLLPTGHLPKIGTYFRPVKSIGLFSFPCVPESMAFLAM